MNHTAGNLKRRADIISELAEKLILVLMCSTCLSDMEYTAVMPVIAVLSCITLGCLSTVAKSRAVQYIISSAYIICCFAHPVFALYLPLTAYDISRRRLYPLIAPALAALIYCTAEENMWLLVKVPAFVVVAVLVEKLSSRSGRLGRELIVTRDSAVEYSNALMEKNQRLLEAQDNEVHLAKLKERNRIAREIHDNVGHMLTRTILQMGAIQIINKDEELKEPLESIKTTLDEAMDSIRRSVHDLHDDSIDLEGSLRDAIAPLRDNYRVNFEYDISDHINGKIKYCFIAIAKEAVNNIIKHSNGDAVTITVRDHPGMCTMCVEDNGKCSESIGTGGIGLENMHERVAALGGVLNITPGKQGFKIFVSIMKKNGE